MVTLFLEADFDSILENKIGKILIIIKKKPQKILIYLCLGFHFSLYF